MRGPVVLFIAVLMLAAASIAIIRSLTSNEVNKHVSPTQTEQLRVDGHPPGSVAGASIETGSADVVQHRQPGTGKRRTATATASAKSKRGAVRSRTHAQAVHHDRHQVYGGGRRVGVDPDLDIRMTLAKQYNWLN